MKTKFIFILLALVVSSFSFSQTTDYEWEWSVRGGGPRHLVSNPSNPLGYDQSQRVRDIAIDTLNNYYFLADIGGGNSSTEPSFGNIPNDSIHIPTYLDPPGAYHYNSRNSYIVSTTCDGEFRWQKTIGSGAGIGAYDIKTDALGGVYVIGNISILSNVQTPVHYDQDSIRDGISKFETYSNNNKGMFLIKYNSAGEFQWLKEPQEDNLYRSPNPGGANAVNLHVEPNGTSHFLVHLLNETLENGQVEADSTYLPNLDWYAGELIVLKYDKDATFLGYTKLDITSALVPFIDKLSSFVYDATRERYYLTIKRDSSFNGTTIVNGVDVIGRMTLFAFDSNDGSLDWWHENIVNDGGIIDMVLDEQGNIYLTGAISRNDSFLGYTTSNSEFGSIVMKIDPSGQLIWATRPDTYLMWSPWSIALNEEEVIIGMGMAASISSLGAHWDGLEYVRPVGWGSDPVVIRFNKTTGKAIKMHEILSAGYGNHDQMTAVAVDKLGNIVVGGFMLSPWLFDNHPIVPRMDKKNSNPSDFFIAKLAKDGVNCDDILSVEEVYQPSSEFLKVYPNPSSHSLNWHCSDTVVFYTIHDLLGRELKSKKLSEQSGTILIDELSPGSYILSMHTASGQRLQQHIVKK